MTPKKRPILAITSGDPAGVGPELCLRLLSNPTVLAECVPVVIGDLRVFTRVAQRTGLPMPDVLLILNQRASGPGLLDSANVKDDILPGQVQASCGVAAFEYIDRAVRGVRAGFFDGVVTAPINKAAMALGGIVAFPGHTEMLQHMTGTESVAMLLYSERIAVSFVTAHIGLNEVSSTLTGERIEQVITLTASTLRRLRGRDPKIAVLALNPHAGENGLFGDNEEDRLIAPSIARAQALGLDVQGPLPADTAFTPAALERYDGFVAMYHDQGAIPFKMLSFDDGVNLTMGLPLIRTSVDHGTAFDIAWEGTACAESLVAATRLAARLCQEHEDDKGH